MGVGWAEATGKMAAHSVAKVTAALLLGLLWSCHRTAALNLAPQRRAVKAASSSVVVPPSRPDTAWPLASVAFSLLPLAAGKRRKTLETTVVPGQLWTHDQLQGVVNVNVPVRSTVIRLADGGLWVHNPVAPTPEYVRMIRDLEAAHGPVKHIVLGTVRQPSKAVASWAWCMFLLNLHAVHP